MVHSVDQTAAVDSGLHSLVLLAHFHQQPCEAEQLKHEFAPTGEFDDVLILRAAKFLQLKAKRIASTTERLAKTPLPAIAKHKDGHYFVIAKADANKVLIHDPLEGRPQTLPLELLAECWSGELILITKRALLPGVSGKFDISWFIPAVVKYRKLLGEVLLASLFLQLLGLASPLFFQAITDKVLVHRALSTLDMLCVGLLFVGAFEFLLGLLRTYLFSHTTNRIDVELGAKLYQHLIGLPIAYFLSRPTGTIVARVKELDSIRQFLTGSALTLVMDLLFGVVFLAIMWTYSTTLFLIVLLSIPCYVILSLIVTPMFRTRLCGFSVFYRTNPSFPVIFPS